MSSTILLLIMALVDFSVFITFYIIDRILSPIAYVHNGDNYNGRDIDSHLILTWFVFQGTA